MENNEIMERLLDDKQPQSSVSDDLSTKKTINNGEAPVSRLRIVTAKYKVYIILLAIFICLLITVYIPNADREFSSSKASYNQVNSQLDNLKKEIQIANNDISYLCDENNGIMSNEDTLKKCLNDGEGCSNLPDSRIIGTGEEVTYDSIPLSYLQLHSLYNKKMPVDEKRVLRNLNEYLIKRDISGGDKNKVGDILRIEIGDPEEVKAGDNHFSKVTVDVQIEFPSVGDLTGFLYNIEKKIVENTEDRILYKIQSVSYDVVANDEPQVTDISMMAYYYHDDRFNDKKECDLNENSESNNETNGNSEDSDDSGSFIQNILGNFKK